MLVICVALGCAVGILPAVAGSETAPTVNALSNAKACPTYYPNCWSPPAVELAAPGAVSFQNSSGIPHGVVWSSVPVTPACTGVPVDSAAEIFKGSCTFSQPGAYRFYCSAHGPTMSGTITVNTAGTTTTTTTTGTTNTTTTQSTGTAPSPPGAPGASPSPPGLLSAASLSLARSQRGRSVHGSLEIPAAAAGGSLEVDLLARRASLAGAAGFAQVQVGRLVRSSLRAGRLPFSVPLRARARGVLARRRRLALIVRLLLTPPHGSPSSSARSIVLHA